MRRFSSTVKGKYKILAKDDDDDEVSVYHVTYSNRLEDIAQHGLTPNAPRSIGAPAYDFHAKGKVFLTDYAGVSFWMHRAEDFANHNSDRPLTDGYVPVVLMSIVEKEILQTDDPGTRDARSNAWFISKKIPPDELLLWDGKRWIDIAGYDSLDLEQAFDIQHEEDEEEPLEFFEHESPFMPKEP